MRSTPPALSEAYRQRGWWSDTRITDLFDAAVRANPHGLAVVDPPNRELLLGGAPQRLDFTTLAQRVAGCAQQLLQLGLRRDDILITQLPNITDYVAVYLAAMRLGVVLSPVPMQFRRHELQQILRLTEARHVLAATRFKSSEPAQEALAAVEGLPVQVLALGSVPPAGAVAFDATSMATADTGLGASDAALTAVSADDIATICWTSGTEGLPKGVPRSHNHWIAISHAHFEAAGLRRGDVLLNPFPLVNMAAIGGCFMSWLHAAGTLVLHHPLDLMVYLDQIATERPQYAIAPPAVLNMLLQDPQLLAKTDLSSLRCIGSGSAPLDPAMIRGFHDRFGIEIVNMFGSNEGMSLVSSAAEAPDPERRARCFPRFGRREIPWPQRVAALIETRLIDADSGLEILDAGRPGEMQIRGPTVFDGYFRAPLLTAAAFTPDGYFRTGDLFEIDGSGADHLRYYRFVGRLKQLIVRGGMKIAPEEIELVLAQHPEVAEASAIAYSDPILGERICAVIVPRTRDAAPSLESIQEHFRSAGFAAFKWPERVRVVDELPRNALGKVLRSALTQIAGSTV